jgi:hypothetical protein
MYNKFWIILTNQLQTRLKFVIQRFEKEVQNQIKTYRSYTKYIIMITGMKHV